MGHWIRSYAILEIVVVAAAVGLSLWQSRRRRHPREVQVPPGFQPTDERFVDPATGVPHAVWYNPRSGKRFYQPIDRNPRGGAER